MSAFLIARNRGLLEGGGIFSGLVINGVPAQGVSGATISISNNYEDDDFILGNLVLQDMKKSATRNALWRITGTL